MTRLSNRQYPMLKTFIERGNDPMSIEEAGIWDQRPFRSMLIQQWIEYVPTRGFRVTKKGRAAWEEFRSTSILRRDPSMPLTAYFDPDAYGLRKKTKVHVMSRRAAA
jgi:hypothetical protein